MTLIQELDREQRAIVAEARTLEERFDKAVRHGNSGMLPTLRRRRRTLKKRNDRLLERVRAAKEEAQQQQS